MRTECVSVQLFYIGNAEQLERFEFDCVLLGNVNFSRIDMTILSIIISSIILERKENN